MASLTRLLCLFCALSATLAAGDLRWLRRASSAAVCAASAFDVASTHRAINQGAIEANPLVARSDGGVRWGRASLLKIGFCAANIVVGELHLLDRNDHRRSDKILSVAQFGMSGVLIHTGFHNLRVGNRVQARPDYLTRD